MLSLLLRRAGFSVLSLLLVSACLFALTRAIPDSPARIVLGQDATEEQVARFERDHGLDQSALVQYAHWIGGIVTRGDLGRSFVTGRPAGQDVARTLPITLELVTFGFCFAFITALTAGIASALLRGTPVDHGIRLLAVLGVSMPGFWLALILILFFAVDLEWFPPGGYSPLSDGLAAHANALVLPVFSLGVFYVAALSRMTRSSLLDVLSQDYMRTARAAGLPRWRVLIYALRNALVPVVTIAGMSFGYMFGWALIIEAVFNINGMSQALLNAIQQRDFVLVQAVVLVFTFIFTIANLVADLINAWLNPRLAAARA